MLCQIIIFLLVEHQKTPNVAAEVRLDCCLTTVPLEQVGWLSYVTMVMYLYERRSPGCFDGDMQRSREH